MAEPRYFPEDVIFSILSKLPAKSVLRFRTVSQSWNAMIRTSAFVSAHHRHQIHNSKNCSQIYIAHGRKNLTLTASATMVRKSNANNQSLRCSGLKDYKVVGYCEGLICLCPKYFPCKTHPHLSLWNPAIQIQKTISIRRYSDQYDYGFGFGFNRRSNDHTVVIVKIVGNPLGNKEFEIYSLVKDCWRRIEVPKELADVYLLHQVASFKGSIYWLCLIPFRYAILRFDVEEEIFNVVELPHVGRHSSMNIKEFNGFLLFLEISPKDRHVSAAWILKEEWICLNLFLPEQDGKTMQVEELAAGSIISAVGIDTIIHSIIGNVILKRIQDGRLFACDGYLDGNNLSFKWEDLKIDWSDQTGHYLTPVVETLILLDRTLI